MLQSEDDPTLYDLSEFKSLCGFSEEAAEIIETQILVNDFYDLDEETLQIVDSITDNAECSQCLSSEENNAHSKRSIKVMVDKENNNKDIARFTLEVPRQKLNQWEEIMKKTGIATKKELLNNALSLFEWVVREKESGHVIASINQNASSYKELVMPAISGLNKTNSEN